MSEPLAGEQPAGVTPEPEPEPAPEPARPPARPGARSPRWRLWRSPPDQPAWARPLLLLTAALAGLAYGWGMAIRPASPDPRLRWIEANCTQLQPANPLRPIQFVYFRC